MAVKCQVSHLCTSRGRGSPSVQRNARQAPDPSRGQRMMAGGPHPTSGLLLYSPQAQIGCLYVFKNREEYVTECMQSQYSPPGPALWSGREGHQHLASAWLKVSKQYMQYSYCCLPKHTATGLTSSLPPGGQPLLPSQKQKTNIWIFTVTRYFRMKKLLVVQFHISAIRSKRKKHVPSQQRDLMVTEDSLEQGRTTRCDTLGKTETFDILKLEQDIK